MTAMEEGEEDSREGIDMKEEEGVETVEGRLADGVEEAGLWEDDDDEDSLTADPPPEANPLVLLPELELP